MATVTEQLRGLVLSAAELREQTNWTEPVVEDYLNIVNNLVTLAGVFDANTVALVRITNSDSPYTDDSQNNNIFANTDDGDVTINLLAGKSGTQRRIANTGTSGNTVIINPNGTEDLLGENSSLTLSDGDVLIITFDEADGWY